MWVTNSDILETVVAFDLEWLGSSLSPQKTQLTQIAGMEVASGNKFFVPVQPMASKAAELRGKQIMNASCDHIGGVPPAEALGSFINWLSKFSTDRIVLVAHNGIRHDGPVLTNALSRYGIAMPSNIYIMDSLLHARYQLRCFKDLKSFSLTALQTYFQISADCGTRHNAQCDVLLLHRVLLAIQVKCNCAYITGMLHQLPDISCIVVHGIGPVICHALKCPSFQQLCRTILREFGDLTAASCMTYLRSTCLNSSSFPKLNLKIIADSIEPAAKQYLQYLP